MNAAAWLGPFSPPRRGGQVNAPSIDPAHMVILIPRSQPRVGGKVRNSGPYVGVAFACLWSTTAGAIAPATPQQTVCGPAVFVLATVTPESPSPSIPGDCKESPNSFCVFDWPLAIKVDRVVAARFPNSSLRSGSVLHIRIAVRASEHSKGVAPEDFQGMLSSSLVSADMLTSRLRNRQFLFGLLDFGGVAQIWSVSFRKTLEATLIETATGLESQRRCPRLTN